MENKIISDKKNNFSSYALICRVIMSFASFLLSCSIIFFVIYIVGNFQNFTDDAQILMLSIISITSILLLIICFAGIIANFVFLFGGVRIKHRIISIVIFIFIIIIGIILLLFSIILKQLSLGI